MMQDATKSSASNDEQILVRRHAAGRRAGGRTIREHLRLHDFELWAEARHVIAGFGERRPGETVARS